MANGGVDRGALSNALTKILDEENEQSILSIVEMGFSREDAIVALQSSDNDVSKAIEYIINGPLPPQQNNDDGNFDHVEFGPATRPSDSKQPTTHIEDVKSYDEDMSMPISRQSQLSESFGHSQLLPATKEFYDASQWGVVPYSETFSTEKLQQFTPQPVSYQLREADVPPLLLPCSEALYIAPLLVILHAIPLGRKSLLNVGKDLVQDYGFDPNWWDGAFIDLPEPSAFRPENSYERMMIETQRLCAFLDGNSRRPFASIRNLACLAPVETSLTSLRGASADDNPVGRFLQDLTTFWGRGSELARTYEALAKTPDNESYQSFTNLIAEVTVTLENSLYGLIDDLIWPPPHGSEAYLEDLADIVTITIKRDDGMSGTGITLPSVWYPDRYTKDVLPLIRILQARKKEMLKEIAELQTEKFQMANTKGKDTSKLLQLTADFLASELKTKDSSDSSQSEETLKALEDIERMQKLFEKEKLELQEKISSLQKRIEFESSLLKGPDSPGTKDLFPDLELPVLRPYLLSGVIISPTEYCFKYSTDSLPSSSEDLIDLTADDDESSASGAPQTTWYRVKSFSNGPLGKPITEQEVLELAKVGSSEYSWQEVILIYANEYAWDKQKHSVALSEPLKKFISQDKRALIQALQGSNLPDQSSNNREYFNIPINLSDLLVSGLDEVDSASPMSDHEPSQEHMDES